VEFSVKGGGVNEMPQRFVYDPIKGTIVVRIFGKPQTRPFNEIEPMYDQRDAIERVVALLSVAICEALRRGELTFEEAEHLLFSPAAMDKFGKHSAELKDLLHQGAELDDIATLIPAELDCALDKIIYQANKILESAPRLDCQRDHWFSRL